MNKTTNKYSPEVRERALRMVLDNQGQHESRWSAARQGIAQQCPERGDPVDLFEDPLCSANAERMGQEDHILPDMIALSSKNLEVNFAAISAGIGMGFLADHEAQASTGLHHALPFKKAWMVPLWLVTHVDLHRTEKVQEMLRHVKLARKDT